MELPRGEDGHQEIGISDLLAHIDCPTRMAWNLRRRETGKQAPESWIPQSAYGDAVHYAIKRVNEGANHHEAVQEAFARVRQWLEPGDIDQLYADLETYTMRDYLGVRTILNEEDCRIPLFKHNGEWVFFRFTIDRLYQRLDDETKFIQIDYKSSKWVKSQQEVDEDKQQWSYNFGIHELLPECLDLQQVYDQLRYGTVPTRKSPEQRASIKRWLIHAITDVIEDESLEPTFNQWCPWCPLKMDCPVVRDELTDFAQARIAALAPRKPKLKKDGTPGKTLGEPELDPERMDEYVEVLPAVKTARKTLEGFEQAMSGVIKELPTSEASRLGYEVQTRSRDQITAEGARFVHEKYPTDFYHVISISKSGLERHFGKNDERVKEIGGVMEKGTPYEVVVPIDKDPDD